MKLHEEDKSLLWKAIKRKYVADCKNAGERPPTQQTEAYFGYGKYNPTDPRAKYASAPTIKRFMIEQGILSPADAISFNTQYLYKKFMLEPAPLSIKDEVVFRCLEYVGFPGEFNSFREAYQEKLDEQQTFYRGYYYSSTIGKVQEFSFSADFTFEPPYDIRQWRLHKRTPHDEDLLYTGTAERNRSYLYCQLETHHQMRNLYLILYTGAGDFKNLSYLFGTFAGVSNNDEPMAGEVVLIKSARSKVIPYNHRRRLKPLNQTEWMESKQAEYYLMLKRNHIKSQPRIPANAQAFARICYNFEEIQDLVGIYKILNYTTKGNLIISWMEINDNLEGKLRTRFDSKLRTWEVEQRCEFQIQQYQGNNYLQIFGYLDDHLHNYAVYDLNFPFRKNIKEQVLMGTFCSCRTNGRELAANHLIAVKVEEKGPILHTRFTTRKILSAKIQEEVKKDAGMKTLVALLDEVSKNGKTWE